MLQNAPIILYLNKTESRITFKIKSGYQLEPLTPEIMKLLGSTKNKIHKDKNRENLPRLKIIEVVLVHCNIGSNDYQRVWKVLFIFYKSL